MMFLVILLTGCGASLVVSAKQNGNNSEGVVKYLNQGADSVIASRRESAFETMEEDCGGPYELTWERPQVEVEEGQLIGIDFTNYGSYRSEQEYWFMGYTCVSRGDEPGP